MKSMQLNSKRCYLQRRLTYLCLIFLCFGSLGCNDNTTPHSSNNMMGGSPSQINGGDLIGGTNGSNGEDLDGMIGGSNGGDLGELAGGMSMESILPVDQLITQIAQSTCDALYRCCNAENKIDFFAPILSNSRFEDVAGVIPPNSELTEEGCPTLIANLYTIAPFGPWVEAAKNGQVTYFPQEAKTCLDSLNTATCGDELFTHLFDDQCFSFSSPLGGESQRKMFTRTKPVGETCNPLTDGVGGAYYGTCDPTVGFCCIPDEAGDCLPGSPEDEGTCVEVSPVGEACGGPIPAQLCATGVECIEGICQAPAAPVVFTLGEQCANGFSLLGECEDGFCDLGGTETCVPFVDLGGECIFGYECGPDLACDDGTCIEANFCVSPE